MLRATNQWGCRSEVSQVVPVHGNISFIPNVFTPNGDEYNESFMVIDLEKSKWDLEVFNRWGRPVYKKDNYNNDWDATGLAAGVYYYTIVNSFCKDRNYKGIISVLR
jgi:gliding motility-associated-like protein